MKLAVWSPRPDAATRIDLSATVTLYGLPVIEIVPQVLSPTAQTTLASADSLIFVSANAVRTLLAQIDATTLLGKQLICIGKRTAQPLQQAGLLPTYTAPPPFTSETLLADKRFWQLPIRQTGIVCARGGRTLLSQTLTAKGKKNTRIICYRRNQCPPSAKVMVKFTGACQINAVLVSSCEVATVVAQTLQTAAIPGSKDWAMFAFSRRIADHVKKLGFTRVIVSPAASQQALNKTLLAWWRNQDEQKQPK